jgi:hypothetical protein
MSAISFPLHSPMEKTLSRRTPLCAHRRATLPIPEQKRTKTNGIGTKTNKCERKWNENGTKLERNWNETGTKLEQNRTAQSVRISPVREQIFQP